MTTLIAKSGATFLALLALTMVPVVGQDDGGRRGGGRPGDGPGGRGGPRGPGGSFGGFNRSVDATMIGLLQVPEVREEVDVMPVQEEALKKLEQENRPERPDFSKFRNASETERDEIFDELRKEAEQRTIALRNGAEEILLPGQMQRLREIAIQAMGADALNDPQVVEELKITDAQEKQIETVREETQDSMRSKMRELFSSGDREAISEAMEGFRKELEEKITGALNAEQKTAFAAMKGDPFDLPQNALRGGFGGRGDRGDGDGERGGRRVRRTRGAQDGDN